MSASTVTAADPLSPIHLRRPPEVVRAGVGRHGTSGLVDRFSLPELWSLHLYSYRATLLVEGRPYEIRPNDVSLVPPRSRIEYRYLGPSQHLYAHLRIEPEGEPTRLPIVQPAGAESPVLTALMTGAVDAFPVGSERARAEVWAVLWRLEAMAGTLGEAPRSRYVADAITYLEANLARPVTVPEVAAHLGISHNHLTRLFQAELDSSVVGYLRTARMALASHLLRDSTMSISAVATTVGIPDLQAFNKACRRSLGASPRQFRSRD
jgi:AraC family transcriptional regulator